MYLYWIVGFGDILRNNLRNKFWKTDIFGSISSYSYCTFWGAFFFIVVQLQLSPFPPHNSSLPYPPLPPTLNPIPLWFCPQVLYTRSLLGDILLKFSVSHIVLSHLFLNVYEHLLFLLLFHEINLSFYYISEILCVVL